MLVLFFKFILETMLCDTFIFANKILKKILFVEGKKYIRFIFTSTIEYNIYIYIYTHQNIIVNCHARVG